MAGQSSPPGIRPDDDRGRERTRSTTSDAAERRGSSVDPSAAGARPAKRRKENHVRSRYPCTLCSQLGLDCQYEAAYTRGRLPSIEIETDDRVLQMAAHARRQSSSTAAAAASSRNVGGAEDRSAASGGNGNGNGTGIPIPSPISIEHHQLSDAQQRGTASTAQSSRNSPEPSQNDQQGHYVGPASGASFLLRIQRKLVHQQSSLSSEASIFTFGDVPLPEFDPSFFILPPQSDAEALLGRYFDFASATHRFLHRPTVEGWLDELYATGGVMRERAAARSRMALLFMVFAQAGNYARPGMTSREFESARYFSAAEHQLSAEKGEIRLTSVQARLAQCFWLLGQSRINHCWSLFGTTAHLVLALGMHRKRRIDSHHNVDYIELECRKRTFWCAYNLDTYLSAALGRPRTFHDEDIDQEIPTCVNDSDLHSRQMHPSAIKSQSLMSGCIAHLKLSRILANILRDLYGIKPPSSDDRYRLAAIYNDELNDWRTSVAYLIETDGVDPSLFLPIFLRQRNVLNLAFWHAQILVHRPFLLSNFAGLTNYSTNRSKLSGNGKLAFHVQKCLDAALNIVRVVDELTIQGQIYSTYWFTHYFAFCAVVVLYVYTIQQRHSPPETYLPHFRAAAKCQEQISNIASRGSLAERYGVVLQELRLEILRHNEFLATQGSSAAMPLLGSDLVFPVVHDQAPPVMGNGLGTVDGLQQMGHEPFAEPSPSSSIAQLTGWGQFDSLVTGGIGSLESLLADSGAGWDLDLGGGLSGIA
ncbi:Transcription factor fungi [Macrophomina phaseolina MS6]|uniref:Transcription factor fungi n=1 Tax=Macrophomina phaseolina (strain MS6) TaxID=1126212 RepID=K2R8H8_MACPH|nr:Transcription factor fungi [Macrophomina phaseolina MS6]